MKEYSLEYNGNIYTATKEFAESNDTFMKRFWYIVKREPKNQEEYDNCINESYIWRNTEIYKTQYA